MSEIGIRIKGELKVNDIPVGETSPQDPLFDDIVNEVGSNTTYVSKIDKIVLVDNTGAERDSVTSLTYSTPAGNQAQITGTISITAGYTVSYVRAYSGTKKYFETSWSRSVASGDKVDVTLTITTNVSGSISGSTTGGISSETVSSEITKAFCGYTRNQIGLLTAKVYDSTGTLLGTFTFSRTIDTVNNKVTGDTGVASPSATGSAVSMQYLNSGGTVLISWSFNTAVSIDVNTRLRIQYTYSVS
jgi:ribosome-associated toxin RatA of RatAB toxin-antitoxin module